ncbi:MAG: histidine kinase [Bacteroidota bacterium]
MTTDATLRRTAAPPDVSFWTLHLGGWAVLGLVMWLGTLGATEQPLVSLAHKAAFAGIGAALTLALRPLYRRLYRQRLSVLPLVAVTAACSYGLSLLWSAAYKLAIAAIDAAVLGTASGGFSVAYLLFDMSLFYSFILVAWSVLYFGVRHLRDARDERERALVAEGLAHEARLEALRYQLNPHFLFNTLNVLSTLIAEERTRDAGRMVARLSDFLRLTLERGMAAEIPLAEELDFVRRYLDVERIRFGDRLQTDVEADPDALSARVPPLLLQPLVENALRHGVLSREDGGSVRVEARRVGERLLLRVEDDGSGPPSASGARGPGVGLVNVRARLEAAFGGGATLRLDRRDGGGTVARIDAPFRTASGDGAAHDAVLTSGASAEPALAR